MTNLDRHNDFGKYQTSLDYSHSSADRCQNIVPFSPEYSQLHDLMEVLPTMKAADVCVMTEDALCQLTHLADPFEAARDLIDRGVSAIVVGRRHAVVTMEGTDVHEMKLDIRVDPSLFVEGFLGSVKETGERSLAIAEVVLLTLDRLCIREEQAETKGPVAKGGGLLGFVARLVGRWKECLSQSRTSSVPMMTGATNGLGASDAPTLS